jgi:hypothetical protein
VTPTSNHALQMPSPRQSAIGAHTRAARQRPTTHARRTFAGWAPVAFSMVISAILGLAWSLRHQGYITAEKGVGYWLGIVGSLILLLLFTYPLRKRVRFLHQIGTVATWFRMHMVLGIIGPTLVVLHSNFSLGSLNSRLALFSMLIVVASGIIGRYLYARVHKGLYGQHMQLREILADIGTLHRTLQTHVAHISELPPAVARLVPAALDSTSFAQQLKGAALTGPKANAARRAILKDLQRASWQDPVTRRDLTGQEKRDEIARIDKNLRLLVAEVRKADRLALYERLFGIWHHLHTPLFALLAITVVMHIIAAELY